jgi:CheY-like chemotaxis protein
MKILLVEDDLASRTTIRVTVEWLGHEAHEAANGREGLEIFHRVQPDLVICDIQMPEMNGLELLKKLRREDHETIIVMVTAFGSEDYARQALEQGADNYLNKPIRHQALLPLLEHYGTIVSGRSASRIVLGSILRREITLQVGNDIELVPQIADRLIQDASPFFHRPELLSIRLGLFEILVNAIEHGNMEIGGAEKQQALEANTLEELYRQRMQREDLAGRKVTIDAGMNPRECRWKITDEGPGFDYNALSDPLESGATQSMAGRGIFLSRYQFDELTFIGKGNVVEMAKASNPPKRPATSMLTISELAAKYPD